jgi:hypothetical protein
MSLRLRTDAVTATKVTRMFRDLAIARQITSTRHASIVQSEAWRAIRSFCSKQSSMAMTLGVEETRGRVKVDMLVAEVAHKVRVNQSYLFSYSMFYSLQDLASLIAHISYRADPNTFFHRA